MRKPRALIGLILVLGLGRPAVAMAPASLGSESTLLELRLPADWLHREGWDLRGPVRTVAEARFLFGFDLDDPGHFSERRDPGARSYRRPARDIDAPPENDDAMEFDEAGALVRLDLAALTERRSQIEELTETDPRARLRMLDVFGFQWNPDRSEVVIIAGGGRYRIIRLLRDAQSRVTDMETYSAAGALLCHERRSYDPSGATTVSRTRFEPESVDPYAAFDEPRVNTRETLSLDGAGRLICSTFELQTKKEGPNGSEHRELAQAYATTVEYPDGVHAVGDVKSGIRSSWSQRVTLNDHGDPIEAEQTTDDVQRARFRWEYEYDVHGNWTKRTAFALVNRFGERSFEPQERIERTIAYFEEEAP